MSRRLPSPERARRSDHVIAAALACSVLALGGVTWLGSDARKVDHQVASDPITADDRTLDAGRDAESSQVPQRLKELWSAETDSTDLVVDQGGVVLTDGNNAKMVRGQDGSEQSPGIDPAP